MPGAKKSKKQRKVGRNAASCARYKNEHRREKNKLRRLTKHLALFPNDHCATGAAGRMRVALGIR